MSPEQENWAVSAVIAGVGCAIIGCGALMFGWIMDERAAEAAEPDSGTITEMEFDFEDITWCVWYEDEQGNEGDDCIGHDEYDRLDVGDEYTKGDL